jgi:hypothetical protein
MEGGPAEACGGAAALLAAGQPAGLAAMLSVAPCRGPCFMPAGPEAASEGHRFVTGPRLCPGAGAACIG